MKRQPWEEPKEGRQFPPHLRLRDLVRLETRLSHGAAVDPGMSSPGLSLPSEINGKELIHSVTKQKLPHHCKAIILQ